MRMKPYSDEFWRRADWHLPIVLLGGVQTASGVGGICVGFSSTGETISLSIPLWVSLIQISLFVVTSSALIFGSQGDMRSRYLLSLSYYSGL